MDRAEHGTPLQLDHQQQRQSEGQHDLDGIYHHIEQNSDLQRIEKGCVRKRGNIVAEAGKNVGLALEGIGEKAVVQSGQNGKDLEAKQKTHGRD